MLLASGQVRKTGQKRATLYRLGTSAPKGRAAAATQAPRGPDREAHRCQGRQESQAPQVGGEAEREDQGIEDAASQDPGRQEGSGSEEDRSRFEGCGGREDATGEEARDQEGHRQEAQGEEATQAGRHCQARRAAGAGG